MRISSGVPFATESELDLLILGVAGVVRRGVVGGHGCEGEKVRSLGRVTWKCDMKSEERRCLRWSRRKGDRFGLV